MKVDEFARNILFGPTLEDKLLNPKEITGFTGIKKSPIPLTPSRSAPIDFSPTQMKFPKASQFKEASKRAMALHFFANHELLAIELMAAAILSFEAKADEEERIIRGIVQTIKDEQKHLKLYIHRMNQLNVKFGDYPLNQFFWNLFLKIQNFNEFFALMALTLEAANLDFCCYYEKIFREHGDHESADILKIVYNDEIGHVALGATWLNKWSSDKSLWNYYVSLLPEQVTPARGKGKTFDHDGRLRAGLGEDFVNKSQNYEDEFRVTKRKEWK